MSEEEQQIAILKAIGWTEDEPWLDGRRCFVRADSNAGWDFNNLPDYLHDLNAMHEAEKIFDDALYCRYINELCDVTIKGNNSMYMATAGQRAEAFLKTIGKWEGGSDELQG